MTRRPKFWQGDESSRVARVLVCTLLPLSWLWRSAGFLRQATAARAITTNPIPVVCIGNAVLGGGGKTPLALWLATALQESAAQHKTNFKVHFSARGYGGQIKRGALVFLATDGDTEDRTETNTTGETPNPQRHGDEPCLLARVAPVWVGRNRQAALHQAHKAGAKLLLADDGLQNPHFKKDFSILCLQARYGRQGFGNGRVFPAGPLRTTTKQALATSDAVFCYADSAQALEPVQALLQQHNFKGALWHGQLRLTLPEHLKAKLQQNPRLALVAFAGIAAPENFFAACKKAGLTLAETIAFPDHHKYRPMDLEGLRAFAERHQALLVTTEKDAVRLPAGFALALGAEVETPDRAELLAALKRL